MIIKALPEPDSAKRATSFPVQNKASTAPRLLSVLGDLALSTTSTHSHIISIIKHILLWKQHADLDLGAQLVPLTVQEEDI